MDNSIRRSRKPGQNVLGYQQMSADCKKSADGTVSSLSNVRRITVRQLKPTADLHL